MYHRNDAARIAGSVRNIKDPSAEAWPTYTLPRVVWYLRLLVLVALETTHLTSVDFVHVHIRVYHQLILADA